MGPVLAAIALATPAVGFASAELDRKFSLETVAVLRAWDNVDGLFADYVTQSYKDYLNHQSRFVYIDTSKVDAVLGTSKIPYPQLIDDGKVLQQAAKSLKAETLNRTKNWKENQKYRFQSDWLVAPSMEILSSETFYLEQPAPGKSFSSDELKTKLQEALDHLIKKIPILGHVTGRDRDALTINLGRNSGLRRGDTLEIATLEEVKRHPLLRSIVDWRFEPTAKAKVENVDEALSFAKITEETTGRPAARFQKIVKIDHAPEESKVEILTGDQAKAQELNESPKLGYFEGTLLFGSLKRDYTVSGTNGRSGSGLLFGAKGQVQLWMTREWFAELGLGAGTASYSQSDLATGLPTAATSVSASFFQFKLDGGYTFFTTPDLFGPRGWVKAGLQTTSYRFPLSTSELTSGSGFTSFFIGIGGAMPIRDPYGFALSLDFGVLNSASSDDPSAPSVSGASSVDLYFGGYYRMDPRFTARVGLEILGQGADFSNGANFSQKVITFGPSLVYYF